MPAAPPVAASETALAERAVAPPLRRRPHAAALGRLLAFPRPPAFAADLDAAEALLRDAVPEAAACLAAFRAEAGALGADALEDLYSRTFDLAPRCVPYLSVHLFGAESFKRAPLMTGLDDAYRRAGLDRGGELPDHLAVVLAFADAFAAEEWDELCTLCLPRPVAEMRADLAAAGNPYRHLLDAVRLVLGLPDLPARPVNGAGPLWRRRRAEDPAVPDAAIPDAAALDPATPDPAGPGAVAPGAAAPDPAAPDAVVPDAGRRRASGAPRGEASPGSAAAGDAR